MPRPTASLYVCPQACDEVILGNIPIETEDEVALLVAQSMAVDLAEEMPEDVDGLVDVDINEYIPIPWRSKMSLEKWAAKVLALRGEVLEEEAEVLQAKYVAAVKDHPLYGTHFFYVRYGDSCCSSRSSTCPRRAGSLQ